MRKKLIKWHESQLIHIKAMQVIDDHPDKSNEKIHKSAIRYLKSIDWIDEPNDRQS